MNNEIDVQNYGVSVGFSLGPILVIAFMIELENTLVPRFQEMETLCR